ncbi:MAG TPA: AAA family ATPase [Bryobacteraceae bacterium]|nr:AAA family ATPase [Bryobacteraceae bacterium]
MPNEINGYRRGVPSRQYGAPRPEAYLYYPASREPAGHEHTQMLEYLHIIQRHLLSIVLLAAAGALAGALIAYLSHPLYRARVTLDIQQFDQNILNMRGNAEPTNNSSAPAESYIQTEIKILESEAMARRVVEKLSKTPEAPAGAQTSDIAAWSKNFSPPPTSAVDRRNALDEIGKTIKARTLGLTRIVEVLCDARDPNLAADFCNSLATEYTAQNAESRWQTAQQTENWLSHQLEDTKKRLAKSEEELQRAAKDSAVVLAENESLSQDKLRQMQTELTAAEEDRMRKQSAYELASASSPESLTLLSDGPAREYEVKLTDLRRQLALLGTTMTPANYRYQEVQSQIKVLESSLQQERTATLRRMKNDYQASLLRQNMLKENYTLMVSSLSGEAPKMVQYNLLKSEVESGRTLYQGILHRVEELGIASAMRASTIQIVDRANPPQRPFSPNWKSNCIVGAFGGVFLGLTLACLRSRNDRSLQDPGEAPELLNLRELGVIPSVSARQGWPRLSRREEPGIMDIDVPESRLELAVLRQKNSALAESFAAAMNSVLFARENGAGAKVFVVTSPEPGDGKSTIASNLAIALAQIDRKVLLVDGDLRRTSLSTLFRSESDPGLIAILRGDEPIDEVPITSVGSSWRLPNFYFMAAGDPLFFEPRLLHSARMLQFVRRVREQFDIVLIDSPPMVHIADARVLGKLADGILLVFRAGKTTIDLATAAQRCFLEDGTHVLGSILNDWSPRNGSRFRGYGSYGRYARTA